jgi:pseudouridine synthase
MKTDNLTKRIRLQRFLADAGVISRKRAEEYIAAGRVLVNGEVVRELPAFVDPQQDEVVVDGTPVRAAAPLYYLVHKPKGVVSGPRERTGRRRVSELLPPLRQKLRPVGQLDEEDSGLLLMTNDGQLAQRAAHPRFGVPKTYWVEVKGRAPDDLAARLLQGVYLAEGKARAMNVEVAFVSNDRSTLNITVREGRKRQVRRMLARLGLPVRNLKCTQIGPLKLKGLPLGASRALSPGELNALRAELARSADQHKVRRIGGARVKGSQAPSGRQRASGAAAPAAGRSPALGRPRAGKSGREQPGRRIVS